MKRRQSRIVQVLLCAAITAGCIGCAKGEAGAPGEEDVQLHENETQEGMQPQENASDRQTDSEDLAGSERERETALDDENGLLDGRFPDAAPLNLEYGYDHEVWGPDQTQIKYPGGILLNGEDLLVCDMEGDRVVRLTTDGEFVESYGEHGSEAGNFSTPTEILLYENEIYVLDSGNMRIQVFDTDMNYVREILFNGTPLWEGRFHDMAIDADGTIYISTSSGIGNEACVFYIDELGMCRLVSAYIKGHLSQRDGVVYAADTKAFYRSGDITGGISGENWLYRVDRDGLQKICELPYMYTPSDFIVEGDSIYAASTIFGTLCRFSMEGEAVEGIFRRGDQNEGWSKHDMYLCVQEDVFYVTDTGVFNEPNEMNQEGCIYKAFRAEGEE